MKIRIVETRMQEMWSVKNQSSNKFHSSLNSTEFELPICLSLENVRFVKNVKTKCEDYFWHHFCHENFMFNVLIMIRGSKENFLLKPTCIDQISQKNFGEKWVIFQFSLNLTQISHKFLPHFSPFSLLIPPLPAYRGPGFGVLLYNNNIMHFNGLYYTC